MLYAYEHIKEFLINKKDEQNAKRINYQKEYRKTDKFKESQKKHREKYRQSEEYKESQRVYQRQRRAHIKELKEESNANDDIHKSKINS